MSQLKKTTTSDLVMGVLLFAFGIFLVVESLGMKVYNSFLDAPGFFPLILGIIFIVFGLVMFIGALRGGSVEAAKKHLHKGCSNDTLSESAKQAGCHSLLLHGGLYLWTHRKSPFRHCHVLVPVCDLFLFEIHDVGEEHHHLSHFCIGHRCSLPVRL